VLAWERIYRLNDKYICSKENSGISGCVSYEQLYCPYWGCERWATWVRGEVHPSLGTAAFSKRKATPDCTLGACNPVNFSISTSMKQAGKLGKSLAF
jgi:hypothetical protein